MALMDRFEDCNGGDYTPPDWKWRMAQTATMVEVDALTERQNQIDTVCAEVHDELWHRVRALERQIADIDKALRLHGRELERLGRLSRARREYISAMLDDETTS